MLIGVEAVEEWPGLHQRVSNRLEHQRRIARDVHVEHGVAGVERLSPICARQTHQRTNGVAARRDSVAEDRFVGLLQGRCPGRRAEPVSIVREWLTGVEQCNGLAGGIVDEDAKWKVTRFGDEFEPAQPIQIAAADGSIPPPDPAADADAPVCVDEVAQRADGLMRDDGADDVRRHAASGLLLADQSDAVEHKQSP